VPSSQLEPVRVALIGYGWFAELLVESALGQLAELELVAVCDPLEERRQVASQRLGVPTYETPTALLERSSCEAVVVLTPHDTHRLLVEQSVAAGRHVFCEKAMAVTAEDCKAMIRAAEGAGVHLLVGHMQKLLPPYARVLELVQSGCYGSPVAINVLGFHWCPVFEGWWRTRDRCGGLVYWTGVHDLDTMRAIMGSEVEEVYALAGPPLADYTEYENVIAVSLRYQNGGIGSLQVCELDPLRRFEDSFAMSVVCEEGAIRYIPERMVVEHAGRRNLSPGATITESFPPFEDGLNAAYRAELAHFGRVIRGIEEPRLLATDGLRCVEVMESIRRSAEMGRAIRVERAEEV
jgi:predicted dehydrogenase